MAFNRENEMVVNSQQQGSAQEYKNILEDLRTRLNVLNTSIFLLEENLTDPDYKTNKYFQRINKELKRIREMIIDIPENEAGNEQRL